MRGTAPLPDESVDGPAAASLLMTVVVPAYQCARHLGACLDGLCGSDLPRAMWQLIVVDDGSTDETGVVARCAADQVLTVSDGPRGPAHARNLGAMAARGAVLVFVDADVRVAPTTLRGFAELFASEPTLTAAFGAYDDQPEDPGLVSQYRNLLHHYVHARDSFTALTFWAGCGGVRREPFLAAGGFDADRYRRPQVEDIDLGYRLRDAGGTIRLVPTLTGTHLKRWSLAGMIRADLQDRAVPWMRLLHSRGEQFAQGSLNVVFKEKVLAVIAACTVLAFTIGIVSADRTWLLSSVAGTGVLVAANLGFWVFLLRRRGWRVLLAAVPLRLAFYGVAAAGALWAVMLDIWKPLPARTLAPLRPALASSEPLPAASTSIRARSA